MHFHPPPPIKNTRYDLLVHARIYHPAGDRRRSRFHLYLGSSRTGRYQQIQFGREALEPYWGDVNHVCWTEKIGAKEATYRFDLRTGMAKRWGVPKSKTKDSAGEEDSQESGSRIESDGKTWTLTFRGKRFRVLNGNTRWKLSFTADGKSPFGLSDIGSSAYGDSSYKVAGQEILISEHSVTAHDEVALLFFLNPATRTAKLLPIDAAWIEVDEERRLFVANSGRRVDPLGDLGVWASDIYVGQLPSGRFHRFPLPFSYASARLRPAK